MFVNAEGGQHSCNNTFALISKLKTNESTNIMSSLVQICITYQLYIYVNFHILLKTEQTVNYLFKQYMMMRHKMESYPIIIGHVHTTKKNEEPDDETKTNIKS